MQDVVIESLCEILIKEESLSKQILLQNGYNEIDINNLLEEGILKQIKINEYKIYSTYELYYYGISLLSKKEIKKANICFELCHKLEPNNRDFILQLFLKYLKIKDYKNALKRFSTLKKIETEKDRVDNNLYLYLLNIITTLPLEYRELVSNLDYDSIFHEDDKDNLSHIKHSIMKYEYKKSLDLLNRYIYQEQFINIEQILLKELLEQVMETERSTHLTLLTLAEDKQYKQSTIYYEQGFKYHIQQSKVSTWEELS